MGPASIVCALLALLLLRTWWVLCHNKKGKRPATNVRCLIVLGSGGHTSEMLTLMRSLDPSKYQPRHYVIAATDDHSKSKADQLEQEWQRTTDYSLHIVPRSREVGQSYLTAIWSTTSAFLSSLQMLLNFLRFSIYLMETRFR